MKSLRRPNNQNLKGKTHKSLSCGCCEMTNFKKAYKRKKLVRDLDKFYAG